MFCMPRMASYDIAGDPQAREEHSRPAHCSIGRCAGVNASHNRCHSYRFIGALGSYVTVASNIESDSFTL
jgi:hypothetical protein